MPRVQQQQARVALSQSGRSMAATGTGTRLGAWRVRYVRTAQNMVAVLEPALLKNFKSLSSPWSAQLGLSLGAFRPKKSSPDLLVVKCTRHVVHALSTTPVQARHVCIHPRCETQSACARGRTACSVDCCGVPSAAEHRCQLPAALVPGFVEGPVSPQVEPGLAVLRCKLHPSSLLPNPHIAAADVFIDFCVLAAAGAGNGGLPMEQA